MCWLKGRRDQNKPENATHRKRKKSTVRGIRVFRPGSTAIAQHPMRIKWEIRMVGFEQNPAYFNKLRISTLRIWGFRGPGFRSARHVFCGDASCLFLAHFPKHLNSVLGRTELCHEVRNPGPQTPQIIRDENHHLALLKRDICGSSPLS